MLGEIPEAAFFVVSCFVIVEMAEDSNAGLVYGSLLSKGSHDAQRPPQQHRVPSGPHSSMFQRP